MSKSEIASTQAPPTMTYAEAARAYHRLVFKQAHRYSRSAELDDLAQEGFLALFAAVEAWPASAGRAHGVPFFFYAESRIRSHLSRVAHYARRRGLRGTRAAADVGTCSLDEENEHGVTLHELIGTPTRDEERFEDAAQVATLNEAIERLSERDRAIVAMVRDGVEHDAIGKLFGVCRSRVWQITSAFLEQVRAALARRPQKAKPIAVPPSERRKTREKGPCIEIVYKGESKRIAAWAEAVGLPHMLVRKRLHAGWSVERALETPSAGEKFRPRKAA